MLGDLSRNPLVTFSDRCRCGAVLILRSLGQPSRHFGRVGSLSLWRGANCEIFCRDLLWGLPQTLCTDSLAKGSCTAASTEPVKEILYTIFCRALRKGTLQNLTWYLSLFSSCSFQHCLGMFGVSCRHNIIYLLSIEQPGCILGKR